MVNNVKTIYSDELNLNLSEVKKEGMEIASIDTLEWYAVMCSDIIREVFRVEEGIYHYVDMREIEQDEYAFCGYVKLEETMFN